MRVRQGPYPHPRAVWLACHHCGLEESIERVRDYWLHLATMCGINAVLEEAQGRSDQKWEMFKSWLEGQ